MTPFPVELTKNHPKQSAQNKLFVICFFSLFFKFTSYQVFVICMRFGQHVLEPGILPQPTRVEQL